ncbi:MAG: glycosyl hydrolase, partial [Flavobacteriia bacterium]|nr:glycosyl hydrolase [Flavobacteriia bacterium]
DWVVYFDQYRKGKFGALKSKDLENWEDISDSISFPDGIRHGTVFKVSKKELSSLRKYSVN